MLDYRRLLAESFGVQFLADLVNSIAKSYREAHSECESRFELPEAHDLEPIIRRSIVEDGVVQLGSRHPNVKIWAQSNKKGHHYRCIAGSGRLVLTVSHVQPDDPLPRRAVFRDGLADDPNQILLFPDAEHERVSAIQGRKLIYAIVKHWSSAASASEFGGAAIAFVSKSYRQIRSIDLLAYVGAVAQASSAVEQVHDHTTMNTKLRNGVTTKSRDSGTE